MRFCAVLSGSILKYEKGQMGSGLIEGLIMLGMLGIGAIAPHPAYHGQLQANPHHYGWKVPGHHWQGGQYGRPTCVVPGTRNKFGFATLAWCDELYRGK